MTYVDSHVHFWIYNQCEYDWIDDSMQSLRRDFLPHDLKPELEQNEMSGCIAVQARSSLQETRWLLALADDCPFILGVVGWVDLCSPQVRSQLAMFKPNSKLIGVRHIVQSEPDEFLLRPDFLRGIAALAEFDLAYDILIYSRHLSNAAKFVEKFPRQLFVLDHLGKPPIKCKEIDGWAKELRELAQFSNVYCKLSGLVTEADWNNWAEKQFVPYLEVALDCFGPSRLMIGSDWPVSTLAASYRRALGITRNYLAGLGAETRDSILGGTAHRFWRLQPAPAKSNSPDFGRLRGNLQ
jgi:L-fuconolactonase